MKNENEQSKSMSKPLLIAIGIAVVVALVIILWKPIAQIVSDPAHIVEKIGDSGFRGFAYFFVLNSIHVFIPVIPAGPFSAAAGLVWGAWKGTFICLLSSTVFAVGIFLWIKKVNPRGVEKITQHKALAKFEKYRHSENVGKTMLLLFLVPGSPKDFLTYFAGFLDISLPEWIVINMIGRFPGVFLTAAGVSGVKDGNVGMVIAVVVGAIVFSVGGKYLKNKFLPDKEEEDVEKSMEA